MLLDVFGEGVTHVGFARSPEFHFHDLRCQPKTALRFALFVQDSLTSIEKGFGLRVISPAVSILHSPPAP